MNLSFSHLSTCPLLRQARLLAPSAGAEIWLYRAKLVQQTADLNALDGHTLLLTDACTLLRQPAVLSQVQQVCRQKQAGALLIRDNLTHDWQGQALFAGSAIPILIVPSELDFAELLLFLENLVYCYQNGSYVPNSQFLQQLYQAAQQNSLKAFLAEMQRWLGGRLVCIIQQDVYAGPGNQAIASCCFYPETWQKLTIPASLQKLFPDIKRYQCRTDQCFFLNLPLTKNQLPYGSLLLLQDKDSFNRQEYSILALGALLCLGLTPEHNRSQAISRLLLAASQGQDCPDPADLLPAQGFAVVLRDATALNQEYIGHLMHFYYPSDACYCFASQHELLIFAKGDAPTFTRALEKLLSGIHPYFTMGVSGQYPKQKLSNAFLEASHAASTGHLLNNGKRCFFFQELGIYQLFSYPEHSWPINKMLDEMTERLRQFEPAKRRTLTDTLQCLVANNYNYKKTSEQLFTHVNTVRYRVGLLEKLWNCNLNHDEDKLLFSLIAKLLPLWETYKQEQQAFNTTPGQI